MRNARRSTLAYAAVPIPGMNLFCRRADFERIVFRHRSRRFVQDLRITGDGRIDSAQNECVAETAQCHKIQSFPNVNRTILHGKFKFFVLSNVPKAAEQVD